MKTRAQIKIAILMPRFGRYGGAESKAYRLAQALAQKGYQVDFICARQEQEAPQGVRVLRTGRFGGLKCIKMLWFAWRAERLRQQGSYDLCISFGKTLKQDVVYVGGGSLRSFWRLSIDAWPKGFARSKKKLLRLLQPANWVTLWIEQHMFHETPWILANSDAVRNWTEEEYPHLRLPAEQTGQRVSTVYNIDLSRFHAVSHEERTKGRTYFGMADDVYAMGLATTNFALKGVREMIQALSFLPQSHHLYVAGGRRASDYEALAARLNVAERVHFLGRVDDMQAFYHSLDLFVLPTFYDALGNVALEAAKCGIEVLCSSRSGGSTFLPPERVFEPGDAKVLARIIAQVPTMPPMQLRVPENDGLQAFVEYVEEVLAEKMQKG